MAEMGDNILQIVGEPAELRRFREQADENLVPAAECDPYNGASPSLFSFHRLFPVPADVVAQDYGAEGWGLYVAEVSLGREVGCSACLP